MKNKSLFITIEGIEGVGKSTCITTLSEYLNKLEIAHILTREPGGTEIAEVIREIVLLRRYSEKMAADTELLLMFAARAQHLANKIKPALQENKWVLCDRFTDATFAYQGGGRGIDMNHIAALETWVQGDLRPDVTILLKAPVEIALARVKRRGEADRIESEEKQFFAKVQDAYLELAAQHPQRYRIVDASQPPKIVAEQLEKIIDEFV